jgi:mannose-6-phosphate isomerase-like protein (cupin superfamily)
MQSQVETDRLPILARPALDNSIWYGSMLISFLATAEMTGARYTLQRMRMQRGFAPPAPHRHGPEDFYILRGQVRFWVGEEEVVATDGDFVRTRPGGWHTLQVESDEAEILAIFAPAGLEGFFCELGRPAQALEPPGGRIGPPDPNRLRALAPTYGIEFSPPGTTPQDIGKLPGSTRLPIERAADAISRGGTA